MNPFKSRSREYRVLAIAVLFFGTGLLFFYFDHPAPPTAPGSATANGGAAAQAGVASNRQASSPDPQFANYPAPSKFATFTYDQSGINGNATMPVSTTCKDQYIAVLVFPIAIDYRGNVISAAYNKAFSCGAGKSFSLTLATSDLAHVPFGKYYFMLADQGTSGTWYNPR